MEHFQSERNGEIQGCACRYHSPKRNGGMSHAEPQGAKEACSGSLFPQCQQLNRHEWVNDSRADLGAWGTCSPSQLA